MRLQHVICRKKELLSSLSLIKLYSKVLKNSLITSVYVLSCAIMHVLTGQQNACFMVRIAKPTKIYTYVKTLCVLTTPARQTEKNFKKLTLLKANKCEAADMHWWIIN